MRRQQDKPNEIGAGHRKGKPKAKDSDSEFSEGSSAEVIESDNESYYLYNTPNMCSGDKSEGDIDKHSKMVEDDGQGNGARKPCHGEKYLRMAQEKFFPNQAKRVSPPTQQPVQIRRDFNGKDIYCSPTTSPPRNLQSQSQPAMQNQKKVRFDLRGGVNGDGSLMKMAEEMHKLRSNMNDNDGQSDIASSKPPMKKVVEVQQRAPSINQVSLERSANPSEGTSQQAIAGSILSQSVNPTPFVRPANPSEMFLKPNPSVGFSQQVLAGSILSEFGPRMRHPRRFQEHESIKLGELIETIVSNRFPRALLLDDLIAMMDVMEPRFVCIQESGYRDHVEFLRRFCRSVLVFVNGISTNLLWDSQHVGTKQREMLCHATDDYDGQVED